jgi:type I restriction-modification system DNA methylase subunit
MGTTKSKGQKEVNDKFYTKIEISKMCIDMLDLSEFDLVIEPSAGNGSFSKQIDNCIAYDYSKHRRAIFRYTGDY